MEARSSSRIGAALSLLVIGGKAVWVKDMVEGLFGRIDVIVRGSDGVDGISVLIAVYSLWIGGGF